jgi:lysylphosphatidylglycerol synthetase-like protein (DUF2156 family)
VITHAGVRRLRGAPVTVAFVAALWGLGAASGSLLHGPAAGLLAVVGVGVGPLRQAHWWAPLTSPFWASGLAAYLLSTVVVLLTLPWAEGRLGSRRTAAVMLAIAVGGAGAGLAVVSLLGVAGGRWADQLATSTAVGPGAVVLGTLLAASAAMPVLWRRRVRLLLVVALVMMALYSGLLPDVLRLWSGLVGLAVGAVLTRPARTGRGSVSRPETRILMALVVAASALGPLIAAIAQTRIGPLSVLRFVFASPPPDAATVRQICATGPVEECADLQARVRLSGIGPAIYSVMPVLLLLVTAEGLRRGRRSAWVVGVVLNLGLAALGLFLAAQTAIVPADQRIILGAGTHVHGWVALALPALQPLVVAVVLATRRSAFGVRAAPGSHRRWFRRILGVAVAASLAYVGGSLVVRDEYDRPPSIGGLLTDLPLRFLPPGYLGEVDAAFLPVGPTATVLYEWCGLLVWIVVGVAGMSTFARTPLPGPGSDLARVRRLLAVTGGSSLAHMLTWPGQSYWFSSGPADPDGWTRDRAVIGYRVIGGIALTTGGPVGDPAGHEETVRGFAAFCYEQGWTPCLYSVGADVADLTTRMGWSAVQVAEETVLPLGTLAFTGKKWQDVRTALNRAAKADVKAEWTTYHDAPIGVKEQIREVSEEWVADKGLPEMGFTLGGLDELDDDGVQLMIAVDGRGVVHGVTSWLPVRRDGVLVSRTLDFMRRRSDGFRGVAELLIASAALHSKEEGLEFLSLSGAPLARLDRGEAGPGLQRLLDVVGRALEPVYGFRSLLAFKAKFQPEYRPWFMTYPDSAALPAIGNAIGRAYLPDMTAGQLARLGGRLLATTDRARRHGALELASTPATSPCLPTAKPPLIFRLPSGN